MLRQLFTITADPEMLATVLRIQFYVNIVRIVGTLLGCGLIVWGLSRLAGA